PPMTTAAPPTKRRMGRSRPAHRNIREPLATVIPTMPTSRPTTRTPTTISHHGLPSGGGSLSGGGRTMFSGRRAGTRSGVGRANPCFTLVPPTLQGSYRSEGCHDEPAHRSARPWGLGPPAPPPPRGAGL